jgi:hypothetical protein
MSKTQKRQIVDYLKDILESISDIREFIQEMTQEDFVQDKKTINAVIITSAIIYPKPSLRRKPESIKRMLDSGSGPE